MSLLINDSQEWKVFEATKSLVKPAINIMENDQTYLIELVAPGLKVKDFNIQVREHYLWIKGAHHENNNYPENTLKQEFYHEHIQFSRCIGLPYTVETRNFKTYYQQGILTIYFGKNS